MSTADRRQTTVVPGGRGPALEIQSAPTVAVVIPCYRVKDHILWVLERIGPAVETIIVVDDACPEHTGAFVRANVVDPRVVVVAHEANLGVGGATRRATDRAVGRR